MSTHVVHSEDSPIGQTHDIDMLHSYRLLDLEVSLLVAYLMFQPS